MSTTIRNAAKGQRLAMQTLYEANKSKVYYVAKCLLLDNKQACAATAAAFKEAWHYLKSSEVSTEDEFTQYVLMKAIGFCKGKAYQKNPKAFRVPFNKNFLLPINLVVKDDYANELAFLLGNLPVMHRYIFVLHTVCGFDELQIGRIMKCASEIITTALEAEEANFGRLQQLSSKNYILSYEEITADTSAGVNELPPLTAIDEQVATTINAIATPVEEKTKKAKHTTCIISVLICACLLVAALIIFLPGTSDSGDTSGLETEDTSYYDDEIYDDEIYDDEIYTDDTTVTDDSTATDDAAATEGASAAEDNSVTEDTTATDGETTASSDSNGETE